VPRIYGPLSLSPDALVAWRNWIRVCVLACALSGPARDAFAQADRATARSKGRPDAPITIYVMSDFQCPFCRDFALTTMPALEREYIKPGKVGSHFAKAIPTSSPARHRRRRGRVRAALQGKFWPAHDRLFQRQEQWAQQADAGPYCSRWPTPPV
jgi:protein-disulfide isomerase